MALRAQRLERLDGGVDLSTDPRELELLEGATRSPDARDVHGDSGSVVSRRGCAPWWDTGEGRPVFWFSFFSPGTVGNQQGVVVTDEDLLFPGTQPTFPPTRATQTTPTTQPPRFLVTSPASGATCQPLSVTVEWTACRGATGYRILAHTSRTLPTTQAGAIDTANCSYSGTAAAGATSKAITLPANNTQYFIWVFASVNNAMVAAQNVPRPLTTKLAAPSNLTTGNTSLTPTLTCDAVAGAGGYVWQIRRKSDQVVVVTSGVLTQPSYTVPSALLTDGIEYEHQVTARDVAVGTPGCEVASAWATFTARVTPSGDFTIDLVASQPGQYPYNLPASLTMVGGGVGGGSGPWLGTWPEPPPSPSIYEIEMRIVNGQWRWTFTGQGGYTATVDGQPWAEVQLGPISGLSPLVQILTITPVATP